MNKKRGMIQSQIVIFVFFLIVSGAIIIFGYGAIKNMGQQGEDVVIIQFKNALQKDVDTFGLKAGAVQTEEYYIPAQYTEICFVDLEHVSSSDIFDHPVIKDSVESGTKQNIFMYSSEGFDIFYVEGLEISNYPYYSCMKRSSRSLSVEFEGTGASAIVNTPPYEEYCQNAEDAGFCDGLDVLFDEGYKDGCCAEYELCC